jgi:hypothetical protein
MRASMRSQAARMEPLSGRAHPSTSVEAAAGGALSAGYQRERIEAFILSCGEDGATYDEVCAALKLDGTSVAARLQELRGEVRNNPALARVVVRCVDGVEGTRKTRKGKSARVHVHVMLVAALGQTHFLSGEKKVGKEKPDGMAKRDAEEIGDENEERVEHRQEARVRGGVHRAGREEEGEVARDVVASGPAAGGGVLSGDDEHRDDL